MLSTKWTKETKHNLEYQLAIMRNFWNAQTWFSLKPNWTSEAQTFPGLRWDAYFSWFFKASQCHQEPTIAFLQKILRLTEASKLLRKIKLTPRLQFLSLASLSQVVPPSSWVFSSSLPSDSPLLPFSPSLPCYLHTFSKPQLPQANYLVKLHFLSETLFHSLFLTDLSRTCPFKLSHMGIPKGNR